MVQGIAAAAAVPRGMLIADVWAQLGDAVAPLSNASGRPLARTVKLILDPLVLRPTLHPRFAGGVIGVEHVDALREAILEAGPALAATAAWFQLVKKARRRAGVTEGHPQDLYFQRCFELAHLHGDPKREPEAARIAAETVAEVHAERGEVTVDRLRRFVTDPVRAAELAGMLHTAWSLRRSEDPPESALRTSEDPPGPAHPGLNSPGRDASTPTNAGPDAPVRREARPVEPGFSARETNALTHQNLTEFLDHCATEPDAKRWKALVDKQVGTAEAAGLDRPGVARGYGLTDRERPAPPEIGDRASKKALPRPFDRSIMERLFAAFTAAFQREAMSDIPSLVVGEIHRSAGAWQLAQESGRVAMALGREASAGLGTVPTSTVATADPIDAAPATAGPIPTTGHGAELEGTAAHGATGTSATAVPAAHSAAITSVTATANAGPRSIAAADRADLESTATPGATAAAASPTGIASLSATSVSAGSGSESSALTAASATTASATAVPTPASTGPESSAATRLTATTDTAASTTDTAADTTETASPTASTARLYAGPKTTSTDLSPGESATSATSATAVPSAHSAAITSDATASTPADAETGNNAAADRADLAPRTPVATSDANARLLRRWQRESYVHRVLRLPHTNAAPPDLREDIRGVRRAYLRRLWARLHGRELRGEATEAGEVWDLLDGVLRSVVMDQRDRLKRSLERSGEQP